VVVAGPGFNKTLRLTGFTTSMVGPPPKYPQFAKACGVDSIFFFLDRIYRIDGIFFACGEMPFGRRPLYLSDPVDPVQMRFK
jgi:hypothetical protein